MMRAMQRLRSMRGATIVNALIAMLIASMVSAVIVNSALSNAGRIREQRQREQEQLIVTSAAEAISSAISVSGNVLSYTISSDRLDEPDYNPTYENPYDNHEWENGSLSAAIWEAVWEAASDAEILSDDRLEAEAPSIMLNLVLGSAGEGGVSQTAEVVLRMKDRKTLDAKITYVPSNPESYGMEPYVLELRYTGERSDRITISDNNAENGWKERKVSISWNGTAY